MSGSALPEVSGSADPKKLGHKWGDSGMVGSFSLW